MKRLLVGLILAACVLTVASSESAVIRGGGSGGSEAQGLGPNFALTDGNIITGATEAKPLQIRGSGGQATSGWNIYQHSNGTPTIKCVIADVEGDCDVTVALSAGKKYQIKNSIGVLIFEVDEATGAVTEGTINVETAGVTLITVSQISIKPVGCSGTTGTLLLDTNATLAPTPTCLAGSTNTTLIKGYADFPDSDGEYQFQDKAVIPVGFTASAGSVDLNIWWFSAATSGAVVWQVATMCTTDNEIEDVAWNTAQAFAADTAQGVTLRLNIATLTGLTMTNCADNDVFHIKIFRQRTHASDTITGVVSFSEAKLTMRVAQ
jgi:hypothetical protein